MDPNALKEQEWTPIEEQRSVPRFLLAVVTASPERSAASFPLAEAVFPEADPFGETPEANIHPARRSTDGMSQNPTQ